VHPGRRFVLLCAALACSLAVAAAEPGPADKAAIAGKPGATPAPTALTNAHSLVGAWYGNASSADTGETGDHVTINNADGSFVSYFRICQKTGVEPPSASVETGRWSVDGNVERTVTLTVGGEPVEASDYYVEHYALRWLSPDTLEKTTRRNGYLFRLRRLQTGVTVPADPCPANPRHPQR